MTVNVLITSVSRKVWLVNAFKKALKQARVKGKVISVDMNPLSAGLYVSDKHYIVPSSSDPNFIAIVERICKRENIHLLVPTRNEELLLFARNKKRFEARGTKVLVSNPKIIATCIDKYKFYKFLTKHDIPTPQTSLPDQVDSSSLKYPLFVKSRYGSGGKYAFKVKNKEELEFFVNYVPDPIVQEFVNGKEYTIDLLSDFESNVLTVVPRERIEVVSGESYKGKTVKNFKLIKLAKNLAEKLGTIGHITIQCKVDKGTTKFIEVNPRFGGGAALGIAAGANTPLLLIKLILGRKVKPAIGKFRENLTMLRYTEDIFLTKTLKRRKN